MIFVSKCLLGENCKYNGGNNKNEKVLAYLKSKPFVAFCPECAGGLPIPRVPSEIGRDGRVYAKDGTDVTEAFLKGAHLAVEYAKKHKATEAILKKNSPSCGAGQIYDGSFTGKKIKGDGIAAGLLRELGLTLRTEDDL